MLLEEELWHELCLCILSSNVPFESAFSAVKHLLIEGLLAIERITNGRETEELIVLELSKPIFLPPRKDGTLRKYRFPKSKASFIVKAGCKLYSEGPTISTILNKFKSSRKVRDFLSGRIPGVGFKQASLFLRNIGYMEPLAIVDVHILNFMKEIKLISPESYSSSLSSKRYKMIERKMQGLANKMGVSLSVLDFAIWRTMRKIREEP
jgi:N-glycosylase/DNA lyase